MRKQDIPIYLITCVLSLLGLAMTACGGHDASDVPVLVVSVEPQRALLEQIVGDHYKVETLLSRGANPETFEPTVATRMKVEKTPAFFATGVLPFESSLLSKMQDINVVNTSDGIRLMYGTHGHGHGNDAHEAVPDPHVWASIRNARIMAENMADAMQKIDPTNAKYYRDNYTRLAARLDSLDTDMTRRFADRAGVDTVFAVWHPSLSYFARDYNLEQLAVGFENKEISPRHLAQMACETTEHGVHVFFFQSNMDSRQAETLNRAMGARMVEINPMAYDWDKQLKTVADALAH